MAEEEKKKKKEFDEDVLEMADVYEQLAKELKDSAIPPTPDAIEAMAVSLLIDRKNTRRATAYAAKQQTTPAPTNVSAGQQSGGLPNEKECPICHAILIRKFKEGGSARGYFACGKDRVYVNEDGKTVPWKSR